MSTAAEAAAKRPPSEGPATRAWVVNPSRAGLLGWLFRYVLLTALLGALGLGLAVRRVARYYVDRLEAAHPDLEQIVDYRSYAPGVTRIHASDGAMLSELAREHRSYSPIDEVPLELRHAFLATEDRRFYEHRGVDTRGVARAIVANVRSGSVIQGGSTITQQVAKGFLTADQTLERKMLEAILAVKMESALSKDQIFEIYLNKIFLGHNAYGVDAAASRYFGKELDELTLAESALIAGLANAPSRFNPVAHPERALDRRAVVLHDMVEAGYIDPAERDAAMAETIELAAPPRDPFRWRLPYYAEHARQHVAERLGEAAVLEDGLTIETPADPYMHAYAREAIDHGLRKIDRKQGWRGPVANLRRAEDVAELDRRLTKANGPSPFDEIGRWRLGQVLEVRHTQATVDLGAVQAVVPLRYADWAFEYDEDSGLNEQRINRLDKALAVGDVVWVRAHEKREQNGDDAGRPIYGDDGVVLLELGQIPRLEAALYTFDHDTGYAQVMEGGRDYDRSQFNRTTQACRQPGSVFKAVYYALALDTKRYEADTVLEGKAWEPEDGEAWNPRNIDKTLDGKVLFRTALIKSMNTPSIRLFLALGAADVVKWTRRLGVTSELIADKALSLGASCMHTDELSRIFGIYVQEGRWVDQVYVRRVTDKRGTVVIDDRHPYDGAMDSAGRIDRLTELAMAGERQVIDRRTAFLITRLLREVVTSGIGAYANKIGVPAGGKSGTASKGKFTTDTWFVGFTSREVTAAWMGDDEYDRSLGDEEASYTTATPMWTNYMAEVVGPRPKKGEPGHRPSRSDQASDALRHYQSLPITRPPGVNSRVVDAAHGGAPIPGLPQAKVWYRTSETVGGDDPAEMGEDPAEMDDDDDDSAPFDEAVDGA